MGFIFKHVEFEMIEHHINLVCLVQGSLNDKGQKLCVKARNLCRMMDKSFNFGNEESIKLNSVA